MRQFCLSGIFSYHFEYWVNGNKAVANDAGLRNVNWGGGAGDKNPSSELFFCTQSYIRPAKN